MHTPRRKRFGWVATVFPVILALAGCSRDVRLAGKNVKSVEVGPVTHYGMTLDENAGPEQVAFVALRAIREDMEADGAAAREASLDVQFSVSAANVLQAGNSTSLTRDEFVYGVVSRWTPTVSHYVGDFETEWDQAQARLHRRAVTRLGTRPEDELTGEECEVAMQVRSPDGNPNSDVVLLVWLAKDRGLWRVTHLGFDLSTRSLTGT